MVVFFVGSADPRASAFKPHTINLSSVTSEKICITARIVHPGAIAILKLPTIAFFLKWRSVTSNDVAAHPKASAAGKRSSPSP